MPKQIPSGTVKGSSGGKVGGAYGPNPSGKPASNGGKK